MPFRRGISWALLFQMSKRLKGNEGKLKKKTKPFLAIFCNFFGMVKTWPFTRWIVTSNYRNQNYPCISWRRKINKPLVWGLNIGHFRIEDLLFLPTSGKMDPMTWRQFAYVSNWVGEPTTNKRYTDSWCQFPSCLPFGALLLRFVLSTEDPPSGRSSLVAEAGFRMQVAHLGIMGI